MIVDLSQFQGTVDWDALAATNPELVIIRAGFGVGGRDTQFSANWSGAKSRGIKRIAYWFCYPAYNSPQAEVADFNFVVGSLGPDEGMAADFENDPNARPWPENGLDWAKAFLTSMGGPNYLGGFYGAPSFLEQHSLVSLADTWWMWIADWFVQEPNTLGKKASLWQFTDCASIAGVNGCVDGNYPLVPVETLLVGGSSSVPVNQGGNNTFMGTMGGFSANGTDHTFQLDQSGNILWGRTAGGAGGQVHVQYVSLGPGNCVEFTGWLSGSTIILTSKAKDGSIQSAWLEADGPWPQQFRWFNPDNAGPFSAPVQPAAGFIPHKHISDMGTPS